MFGVFTEAIHFMQIKMYKIFLTSQRTIKSLMRQRNIHNEPESISDDWD